MGLGDGVDSFLSCPCCKEGFKTEGDSKPMSLRCGHTFCSACLHKTLNKSGEKSSLKCSACRQVHSCENRTGAGLWFPNHSMVEIIVKMASKSKFFCPVHQHDMNYYCFNDDVMVCIYCAYHGDHSSHNCKHVEEAKKEADMCLKKAKVSVSSYVTEMERRLQFVKDEREMLKSQETSIRQVIEDSYEKLKSVLLRQRQLLFQELQDQTADIGSGIELSVKKVDEHYCEVKAILSDYTSWKSLPCRDALEQYNTMKSRLSSIAATCSGLNEPQLCEPCPKISFQMSGLSQMLTFGDLGRIVVGGAGVGAQGRAGGDALRNNSREPEDCDPLSEPPPTKKRKNDMHF